MPKCTKCNITKPLSDFYGHPGGKHKKRSRCKSCINEQNRLYYQNNKERIMKCSKRRYHQNREIIAKRKSLLRKKDPKKFKIRELTSKAIRLGYIKRPETCPKCNRESKYLIEPHHKKYEITDDVLNVTWLCKSCHMRLHGKLK